MIDPGDLVPELADLCRAHEIVGAAVGVSIGGERSVAVHGVTHVGTGVPVERATWFQAGSVTKAMTATAVAMLVADGSVGLDEPVISYVPEFRVHDEHATRAITVRHLLTHTAGFDGDVWPDHGDDDGALGRLVAGIAHLPQLSPPGRAFSYSNVGYAVLGRLVERVVAAPFAAALRTMVADAADARLEVDVRRLDPGTFAVGHLRGPEGWAPIEGVQGPACLAPAGSRTWATVDDLLRFGELHLGRRSPQHHEALVAMRQPHLAVPDPNNGGTMALGVLLDDRWGSPVVLHDGGVAGQSAYLRILPELDAVLVVMATGGVPQVFHRHVFRALARSRFGLEAPAAVAADPSIVIDAARVAGVYDATATRLELRAAGHGIEAEFRWRAGSDEVSSGWLPVRAANDRVLLAPFGGRDLVIVTPPAAEPCDHVLQSLRRVNRRAG
ncbi:unannotated protein [freshwater metagenome]|uniref:Unannotated protein n=1 Tax=freshwater metagenome TaxID=449393 RepID=A0A6J6FKM2_9ZZZZ